MILVDVVVGGVPLMEACRKGLESPYITKVVHDCKRDSEVHHPATLDASSMLVQSFRGEVWVLGKEGFWSS